MYLKVSPQKRHPSRLLPAPIISRRPFSRNLRPRLVYSSAPDSDVDGVQSPLRRLLLHHLPTLFSSRISFTDDYDRELALVSILKACASAKALSLCQLLHSLVLKSGLDSNSYVNNSLLNVYAKCGSMDAAASLFDSSRAIPDAIACNIMIGGYVRMGRVKDAYDLFEKMPSKGCVSYTTMMMGFSQNNCGVDAVRTFKDMMFGGLIPNEVTLSSLVSACSQLSGGIGVCKMLHGLSIKLLLDTFVIVSTNLLNMYCVCSSLGDARILFKEMPERNLVSWNVMLNGYSKAGLVCLAKELFDEMPSKDVVSWGTMINGYTQVGMTREGLRMCREMMQFELRPNDVMLVDLISSCARSNSVLEGQQLHCMIIRCGFDPYDFVQATVIHFYAACGSMDLACLQHAIGFNDHLASLNALIAGFARNGMLNRARKMFDGMSERDIFSWSAIISAYVQDEQPATALELFHRMAASECCPNEVTMTSVFCAIAALGSLSEGRWAHEYVVNNAIPMSSNLSASIIDMYTKCGSIESALEVFHQVRDTAVDVSPWNAIICGLAMHGHAGFSLKLFSNLQSRPIKLSPITFIGVLTACCHSGLVEEGKKYFRNMKRIYNVEPDIKHYGCMVDMLGRAGRVEEAETLIQGMPMKADLAVWGSLLTACRTHGNVEIAERAVKSMVELDPSHGPCRIMLSNIYANAGRWSESFLARRALVSCSLERSPGLSGVV